ncbi:dipeptidase [Rhizobium binxianense]
MSDPVLAHAEARKTEILDRLCDWIRCPSVGADPAFAEGMEAARRLVEARIAEIGFTSIRRLDGGGQPSIYGEWLGAPGKPTILVYGHYDVQPPDPLALWTTPPFEPTVRDGRLYARGASDDKGPTMIALETLASFLAMEGRLPVNVKLLIEGEEETGSPSLPPILSRYRALLASDAILSADGARWRPDLVSVNVGSRGNGGFEFTVRTAKKDLHSGRYGGVLPNALHVMARIVAGLHDENQHIAIPGFYDGVAEPSEAEQAELASIPMDADAFYAGLGTAPMGEAGYSFLERQWLRPTLEVNGMWGGYTGAGGKTVIPNEAHAKVTMRLVPGQQPEKIRTAVEAHLQASCPPGATIEIGQQRGWAGAYEVPPRHPLLLAAEAALQETTGVRPTRVRIGATLPLTEIVERTLGIDTVMFSFATADEDYHAPNEFLRLSAINEGLAAWTAVFRHLAGHSAADYAAYRRDVPAP